MTFIILKETKNFDIILHLAALISIPYSYNSPASYIHTNIIGTLNCLEAVRVNKIKLFIHLQVKYAALQNLYYE